MPKGLGRLAGKVAVVSGAGSRGSGIGNGRAIAILFAREGARVALLDQRRDWAEETARMIAEEAGESRVFETDVSDAASVKAAVDGTVGAWGRLDILVNVVGIFGPSGTAVEVDPEAWDKAMRVNLTSMVLTAKYAIPEMRKAGGGSIVNISSVAGLRGGSPNLFYPTSKGAVVNLTRAMAAQHGREGIRVNAIAPGMVFTPMVSEGGMSPELREARRRRSLLHTEGTAWDIAEGALYLAGDGARWVTGVILPIDAGATAGEAPESYPIPEAGR
jgi:NAD(P)-dependent dehydrogenase (short-subunit alcohol dehydrogenase family)